MKLLDLFAGIGGFSLAAHWLGWKTIAFVEKDEFCQKVLRKNFGSDIEIYDDITAFSGKPFRGRCDIITGGFPCQPFSQAGKQQGRADERHLFPEMLRVISEVKPRWVVAENVRGILSIHNGELFEEVAASLESEGYEVATFCLPACAVDAPHRRDRIWIVAHTVGRGSQIGRDESGASLAGSAGKRQTPETDLSTTAKSNRERVVTDADDERYIGRCEQGQDGKRQIRSGRGNDRTFGESAIGDFIVAGVITDSKSERSRETRRDSKPSTQRTSCGDSAFVTDAANTRLPRARRESQPESAFVITGNDSRKENTFADAGEPRLEGRGQTGTNGRENSKRRTGAHGLIGQLSELRDIGKWDKNWLEVATEFCRVDARVPNRVDRLRSLGNAIVPQIAFEIFKAIEEVEASSMNKPEK